MADLPPRRPGPSWLTVAAGVDSASAAMSDLSRAFAESFDRQMLEALQEVRPMNISIQTPDEYPTFSHAIQRAADVVMGVDTAVGKEQTVHTFVTSGQRAGKATLAYAEAKDALVAQLDAELNTLRCKLADRETELDMVTRAMVTWRTRAEAAERSIENLKNHRPRFVRIRKLPGDRE